MICNDHVQAIFRKTAVYLQQFWNKAPGLCGYNVACVVKHCFFKAKSRYFIEVKYIIFPSK